MLNIIDSQWKDHLLSIDHLKQGIGFVGYGQKDPLVEYKKQSFDMFQDMLDRIDTNTVRALFNLEIVVKDEQEEIERLERLEMQRARRQASGNGIHRRNGNGNRGRRHRRNPPHTVRPRPAKGQTERPVLLRLRQKIQKMPRRRNVT